MVSEIGGGEWESNPPATQKRGADGFEDRGNHRAPVTLRCLVFNRREKRMKRDHSIQE